MRPSPASACSCAAGGVSGSPLWSRSSCGRRRSHTFSSLPEAVPPRTNWRNCSTPLLYSTLPDHSLFAEETPSQWNAAFRLLAEILPDDTPSVVVIDEVPYLMERIDAFEGMLQRAWDRLLSRKPVLLLLVGSDLSMMEALNSYDRPFHQRGREMVVGPLNPADISEMLDLEPAAAFDAALITGGLPLICREWKPGTSMWDFLDAALENPISALLVSAERSLAAEFPRRRWAGKCCGRSDRVSGPSPISRALPVASPTAPSPGQLIC